MGEKLSDTAPKKRNLSSIAAARNRARSALLAEEAFVHYLGLGVRRSYRALQDRMEEILSARPGIGTITRWANTRNADGENWADRVEKHEIEVQLRMHEILIATQATRRYDVIASACAMQEVAMRRAHGMLTGARDPVLDKLGIKDRGYEMGDKADPLHEAMRMIDLAKEMQALVQNAAGAPTQRVEHRLTVEDPSGLPLSDKNRDLARRYLTYVKRGTAFAEGKPIEGPGKPVQIEGKAEPQLPETKPETKPEEKPKTNGSANPGHPAGAYRQKPPVTLENLLPSSVVSRKKPNGGTTH